MSGIFCTSQLVILKCLFSTVIINIDEWDYKFTLWILYYEHSKMVSNLDFLLCFLPHIAFDKYWGNHSDWPREKWECKSYFSLMPTEKERFCSHLRDSGSSLHSVVTIYNLGSNIKFRIDQQNINEVWRQSSMTFLIQS